MANAALLTLFLSTAAAAPSTAPLTLLSDSRARCMDGSLSGFYHLPNASAAGGAKWTIFLQGGGECTTQSACTAELNGPLGSSKFFPASTTFGEGAFYGDVNAANNPLFFDAHHVDVPYCSGDLHSGTGTSRWGLSFSGHLILDAVLTQLDAVGLQDAAEIVFFGASAGGIGTWLNLDWVAGRYPKARVVGAPVAGFYFYANAPYAGPGAVPNAL